MSGLGEVIKSADWKAEKHVPVIEVPDSIQMGQEFNVKVSLGKGIPHPNTTEHHIAWISLFFLPEGSAVPFQVGHMEFTAHGESVQGPNQGPLYTSPSAVMTIKTNTPGTLQALAFCNIHGLWQSSTPVTF